MRKRWGKSRGWRKFPLHESGHHIEHLFRQ